MKRVDDNLVPFAKNNPSGYRFAFGTDTATDDINVNYNDNIKKGWGTTPNEFPEVEDFNAMAYTSSYLTAYLYQMGIPEWNDKQKYRQHSRAMGSDGIVYKAKTGTDLAPNVNNNPVTDNTNWEREISTVSIGTIEDLATFTGTGLVMVKDINRGGIFVSKTEVDINPKTGSLYVANHGTVFAKLGGGFWVRQYSGAVDVKWFGDFNESNFNSAKAYSTLANKTLLIDGVFNLDFSIDFLENTNIEITGSSILNVTGTQSTVFNFNKNSKLIGNGAKINISNSAWGGVVLNCEADRITHLSNIISFDLNLVSTYSKGIAIKLSSNTTDYRGLNFNLFSNIKYEGFNYGILLDNPVATGNGWINSNTFDNCISLGNKKALWILNNNINGEISANTFNNCDIQTGTADTQIYIYNSKLNDFSGFIWDWVDAQGNPIVLDGTSSFNIIKSNIDMDKITGSSNNQCSAYSGAKSGQSVYQDSLTVEGAFTVGKVGQSKVHPIIINPEVSGNAGYTIDNISGILRIYPTTSGVTDTLQLSSTNLFVGNSTTNTLNTKMKVKGASSRHAMSVEAGTDGFYGIGFLNSAGSTSGGITINTSAVVYGTSSDYRLKEDLKPIENAIEKLMKIKPVNFSWKIDNTRVDGFIAHELQEIIPEAVTGVKDGMRTEEIELSPLIPAILDENGNIIEDAKEAVIEYKEVPDYQGVDQSKIIPILTASLQEAIKRIEALEEYIKTIK